MRNFAKISNFAIMRALIKEKSCKSKKKMSALNISAR